MPLEHRHRRCHQYSHQGQGQQEEGKLQLVAGQVCLEYEKIEANQYIDGHLGGACGQEHRHHVRGVSIRIRQPHVQGKDSGLQGQPDRDETRGHQDRIDIGHAADPGLQVSQVERARHHIDQADADQVEGGADGAHDQVFEYGRQCPAIRAAGDDHVAGQGGNLHKHEDIEGIGRDGDADQAGQSQQKGGVEQGLPFLLNLQIHTGTASEQGYCPGTRDDQQHQRTERVDRQFDAVGCSPATHVVTEMLPARDSECQRRGDTKTQDRHGSSTGPGQPPGPQQQHQRC